MKMWRNSIFIPVSSSNTPVKQTAAKSPCVCRKYIFKRSMFQPAMLVYPRVLHVLPLKNHMSNEQTVFLGCIYGMKWV